MAERTFLDGADTEIDTVLAFGVRGGPEVCSGQTTGLDSAIRMPDDQTVTSGSIGWSHYFCIGAAPTFSEATAPSGATLPLAYDEFDGSLSLFVPLGGEVGTYQLRVEQGASTLQGEFVVEPARDRRIYAHSSRCGWH